MTPFLYRRPERFRLANMRNDFPLGREGWTVDTADDLAMVRRLWTELSTDQKSQSVAAEARVRLAELDAKRAGKT